MAAASLLRARPRLRTRGLKSAINSSGLPRVPSGRGAIDRRDPFSPPTRSPAAARSPREPSARVVDLKRALQAPHVGSNLVRPQPKPRVAYHTPQRRWHTTHMTYAPAPTARTEQASFLRPLAITGASGSGGVVADSYPSATLPLRLLAGARRRALSCPARTPSSAVVGTPRPRARWRLTSSSWCPPPGETAWLSTSRSSTRRRLQGCAT